MKTQKPEWNAVLVRVAVVSLTSWFCASQAADTNVPAQSKPFSAHQLSEQEKLQRERTHQQVAQFEARAKAAAETRRTQTAARRTRMVPPHLVKQYDTNGNGLIDPQEWRKYRQDVDQRTAELLQASGAVSSSGSVVTNAPGVTGRIGVIKMADLASQVFCRIAALASYFVV